MLKVGQLKYTVNVQKPDVLKSDLPENRTFIVWFSDNNSSLDPLKRVRLVSKIQISVLSEIWTFGNQTLSGCLKSEKVRFSEKYQIFVLL